MEKPNYFLALLRGINVGGKNIIKMADLKNCFETMGFTDVSTYIQSGNVIFFSAVDQNELESIIEKTLSETFNYKSRVVVINQKHLLSIVEKTPEEFGLYPDDYKYDVVFLKQPLTADGAIGEIIARKDVDNAYSANGVIYFSRAISHLSKSYLSKIITLPIYQYMTIRNWNTTSKLLHLMNQYK